MTELTEGEALNNLAALHPAARWVAEDYSHVPWYQGPTEVRIFELRQHAHSVQRNEARVLDQGWRTRGPDTEPNAFPRDFAIEERTILRDGIAVIVVLDELPPHVAGFDSNGEAYDQAYLDGSDREGAREVP
jgi:hypothetical protein